MERRPQYGRKYLQVISNKGSVSRGDKELLEFNNKRQTTQFKSGQRTWIDFSSKKIYKWPISTWKPLTVISHQGNVNQSHSQIPPRTSRMPVIRTTNDSPCEQAWRTGGLTHCQLGNSLTASQQFKHRPTVWPSNSLPRYTPKRNENKCPHKNLCAWASQPH